MSPSTPVFVSLVVAAAVALYSTVVRCLQLRDTEFVVCVAVLSVALAVLALGWQRVEGFADSAKSIADDLLLPHLDKLVAGLDRGKFSGPFEDTASTDFKAKSGDDPTSGATDPTEAKALVLQYRRVGALLCSMAEMDPERFARLREALGVSAPAPSSKGGMKPIMDVYGKPRGAKGA
jgi:hypothetical protein